MTCLPGNSAIEGGATGIHVATRCTMTDGCSVHAGWASPSAYAPGLGQLPYCLCGPALEAVSWMLPIGKAMGASVIHSAQVDAGGKPSVCPPGIPAAPAWDRASPNIGPLRRALNGALVTLWSCCHIVCTWVTQKVGTSLTRQGKQG